MPTFFKYYKTSSLLLVASLLGYYLFAYKMLRTDTWQLISLYTILFVLAYYLKKTGGFNFRFLVISALLIRLVFLIAIPNLSQDFYRFIWDGRIILEGFNPYLHTPESFITQNHLPISQAHELYRGMGKLNASHYTNYPPLHQLCFVIGNLVPGKSILSAVIGLRLIIILADIGIIYFGKRLLEALKLPSSRIWWYALNPFIIIELTGNLHFEGVMLFFLIWSLYLLYKGHWKSAALVYGCSISVKLIPLMFLPLVYNWFRENTIVLSAVTKSLKPHDFAQDDSAISMSSRTQLSSKFLDNLITFYSLIIGTILLLFLPFLSIDFINNYSKTVGLWFTNFEFNASIYYLLRKIGYMLTGYNQIAIIGKVLPLITIVIILGFSFFKKNTTIPKLTASIVLVFSCYLFLSTTVHPWYLATLVLFCVFTNYRFPLVWSFVVILSYLSYLQIGNAQKAENLYIIGLEYAIVFAAFLWEVVFKKRSTV